MLIKFILSFKSDSVNYSINNAFTVEASFTRQYFARTL